MSNFDSAVQYVIQNEGTQFTNNPNDSGGATKFGITQQILSTWRQFPSSPDDVKNLLQPEAEEIYRRFFWSPLGCEGVGNAIIATAILDTAVLNGIGSCARWVQESVGAQIDGHIGDVTINKINETAAPQFLANFVPLVTQHYIDRVIAKPTNIEFLKGWVARAEKLFKMM